MEIKLEILPYEYIRYVDNQHEFDTENMMATSDMKKIKDLKDNVLLLFAHEWSVKMVLERNEGLKLSEFGTQSEESR